MKKSAVAMALAIVLLLMLALALVVFAQEPQGDPNSEPVSPQEQVGSAGLADPAGPGQVVLYMFTGAAVTDTLAVSIHCTNYGQQIANLEVQLIDKDSSPILTDTETIFPNHTATFSSQDTAAFIEDPTWGGVLPSTGDSLDQGSGRILAQTANSTQVICAAELLDPANNPPTFSAELPLYDSQGNPIGEFEPPQYLPVILKKSQ